MSTMQALADTLQLRQLEPTGGGSINDAFLAEQEDGRPVFVKTHPAPPPGFFAAEAAGLKALAEAGAPVPEVLALDETWLLLSRVDSGRPGADSQALLGRVLAALHGHSGPSFGFREDNFCGTSPQDNRCLDNGHEFFATCRLLPQGARAYDQGLLTRPEVRCLERLCQRLPELIPPQPPSLIHGDLWAGNVMFDAAGDPVLIDPAVSWCWAEADLAMTRLFGGFGPDMLAAYEELRSLEPGFPERVPLYNLYHLLNHLNLFGAGYHAAVVDSLRRHG